MTRDYARNPRRTAKTRNSRRQPSRKTTPGWIWLIVGIFVGVIGIRVYDYQGQPIKDSLVKAVKPANNSEPPAPRFDFYTLLTENEEVIPNDPQPAEAPKPSVEKPKQEITQPSTTVKTAEPQKTEPSEVYVLQAGAFRSASDADSVRARLLLLNMQATVETVTPRPGETWHRVLIGPFSNTTALAKSRQVLQQNGIDSIQMKRRL